ncbi:hypothetical protein PFISCL1PPCAC_16702, partial [Pristionchus fissidentatus]
ETVKTAQSEENASTPEISQTGSEKKKRQYKLKNDAQRKDPNYQRNRVNNNRSVEKCRQKKKKRGRRREEKKWRRWNYSEAL